MAGTDGPQESDCTFQWDENSQLYYHASTGFYHDPQAGWYYSSRDGLYYKFEDGNYVLLESNLAGDQSEFHDANSEGRTLETQKDGAAVSDESSADCSMCISSDQYEYPPPASEWLEDTLIDMYLSGYSNQTANAAASDMEMPVETNDTQQRNLRADGEDHIQELEEGEWIPDEPHCLTVSSCNVLDDDMSLEEENWRAQYGQVIQPNEEWISDLHLVDLWEWALVKGIEKVGKSEVARLVGRLKKRSSKLHPSISSASVRTAPVCEVHLDMDHIYRDRAAERRALHGGFGIGPEQKNLMNSTDSASSPISLHPEDAAVESLSISFGTGSYARKILQSMGWKEGEALGRGTNGLTEPLQAIGNKGNAGLGWDNGRN